MCRTPVSGALGWRGSLPPDVLQRSALQGPVPWNDTARPHAHARVRAERLREVKDLRQAAASRWLCNRVAPHVHCMLH